MTPIPGIALVGHQGVGKTAIAEALVRRGFTPFSWASPAKTLASWAYGPINKARAYEVTLDGLPQQLTGREILQRITTEAIRANVDEDFWVRIGAEKLDQYPELAPWVNDDTRLPNEVDALARRGFVIVRIVAPDEVREKRLFDRDGGAPATTHLTDTSVNTLDVHFSYQNTTTVGQAVDTILGTIQQTIASGGRFTNQKAA